MRVVFRADANPELGTGHVVRCLTLADRLKAQGAQVAFASRQLPDHLQWTLTDRGCDHVALPPLHPALQWTPDGLPAETPWPEACQLADAQATAYAVGRSDVWVVDHYGLGVIWEQAVRPFAQRLMALDDLGRHHRVDVLLDQNLHSSSAVRYEGRVGPETTLLLGPRFALLRPEFAALRTRVQARSGPVQRVMVFMGGMDTGNLTNVVLQAWDLLDRGGVALDVVIGVAHPDKAGVLDWCSKRPSAHCHVQTNRMAELMLQADLAVGAGGGTTWERCALGLPTLALCVADNQRAGLDACAQSGWLYVADANTQHTPEVLAAQLSTLMDSSAWRKHMSCTGMVGVDGLGAERVARVLVSPTVHVRPATEADSTDMHLWRNHPTVRAVSVQQDPIPWADHQAWFARALTDSSRCLLVGHEGKHGVGVVRFDTDGSTATVSVFLNPEHTGRGLGLPLLQAAQSWLLANKPWVNRLVAEVLPDNQPSIRLFENAGYRRERLTFLMDVSP